MALALTASAAGAYLALRGDSEPSAPQVSAESNFKVVDPEDGQLAVAGKTTRQLAGSCDAKGCLYEPTGQTISVSADADSISIPMKASKSKTLSIAATPLEGQSDYVFTHAQGRLNFNDSKPGSYQVTVTGDNGAVWQFNLTLRTTK